MNKILLISIFTLMFTGFSNQIERTRTNYWKCQDDFGNEFVYDMRKGYSFFDGEVIHFLLYDTLSQGIIELIFPQEDFWQLSTAVYTDQVTDTTSLENYLKSTRNKGAELKRKHK